MLKVNCPFCSQNVGGVCVIRKQFVRNIDNDSNCPSFTMNEYQKSRRAEIIRRIILWLIVVTLGVTAIVIHYLYC
jgi:hypothetical protein